jgi:hypothetical protein
LNVNVRQTVLEEGEYETISKRTHESFSQDSKELKQEPPNKIQESVQSCKLVEVKSEVRIFRLKLDWNRTVPLTDTHNHFHLA